MPLRSLAIVVLVLTASAARAQDVCPTAADLERGIAVTYGHGGTDTFTADPRTPGAVVWQGEFEGISLGTSVLAGGYAYLSAVGPDGLATAWAYDSEPGALPAPAPGATWELVATVTTAAGESTERQSYAAGPGTVLTVGPCNFTVVPLTVRYPDGREDLLWFAELGLSLRAGDPVAAIVALP